MKKDKIQNHMPQESPDPDTEAIIILEGDLGQME